MNKLVLLCVGAAVVCLSTARAAIIDLTTAHSSATLSTSYGTVIFTTDFSGVTGTGNFQPFLSMQGSGSTEQGYNTSGASGVFDTKREGNFTHDIQVKDLAKVAINGADYYSFVIDVNEANGGSKPQISLDVLKIYTSSTGSQTTTNVDSLGAKRFDLDLPGDSTVLYNNAIGSGSGSGDIAFFIPVSAFVGASPNDYVYMYQAWGGYSAPGFDGRADSGYEETAIGVGVVPVPEFSSLLPLGLVMGSVVGVRQLRRRRENSVD